MFILGELGNMMDSTSYLVKLNLISLSPIDHVVIAKSSALFRSTIIQDNSSLKLKK